MEPNPEINFKPELPQPPSLLEKVMLSVTLLPMADRLQLSSGADNILGIGLVGLVILIVGGVWITSSMDHTDGND